MPGGQTHHGAFPAWTTPGDARPGREGACWERGHITAVKAAACSHPTARVVTVTAAPGEGHGAAWAGAGGRG